MNNQLIASEVIPSTKIATNWDHEKAWNTFKFLDVNEETRKDYQYRIGHFLNFISDKGLDQNSFLEYKNYLKRRTDYTVSTKNKYLITAKIFLKELNRRRLLPVDITQNIKSFSHSKKHKKEGLNDQEIEKLTLALKELPNSPHNARIKAMIGLLVLQGLRQVEITRLDVKDIDLIRNTALIEGKGRDDKEIIYLHPETARHIKRYLKANNLKDGALFVSNSNNSRNTRITTRGLRLIIKKVLKDLDIEKSVHGFRHYFTTTLLKNYQGDLLRVAQYTRHKSLEMLQVYNDNIEMENDLPRYYKTFKGVKF
ncbi:MAG: tyrosine-type recombinase/integrase [Atribacterota bacterium]|nr:tyrosine-type recombinase/integrase [Atribacterota bacterium]